MTHFEGVCGGNAGLLMGDDISLGLSSMAVCFDFCSTNIVKLSNRNPYFHRFQCHHPLMTEREKVNNSNFASVSEWFSFQLFCLVVFSN